MLVPSDQLPVGLELPKIISVVCRQGYSLMRYSGHDTVERITRELTQSALLVHSLERVSAEKMDPLFQDSLEVLLHPSESRVFIEQNFSKVLHEKISQVSLVGFQLQQDAQVSAQVLSLLSKEGIKVLRLTSHSQSITVLLSDGDASKAVAALHRFFIEERH